jgi:uncharacterized protein (DUF2267 family)
MSATGLEVFDKTIHTTNVWLDEIMEVLGPDRHVAWHALGGVLRTVRNRVPLGLASHLGAQLPLMVRGAYYDHWRPGEAPERWRSRHEFLEILSQDFRELRPVDPKDAATAVFRVLQHHIDPGQAEKVRDALPQEVREMWPDGGSDNRQQAESAA